MLATRPQSPIPCAQPKVMRVSRAPVRHLQRAMSDDAAARGQPKPSDSLARVLQRMSRFPKSVADAPKPITLSSRGVLHKALRDVRKLRGQQDMVREEMKDVPYVAENTATFTVALITYSTLILAWATELGGSSAASWVAPTIGAVLGGIFAAAHRLATVRIWKAPTAPLNVVITGGTRGIGRALAREFLLSGDNVYIAARSARAVRSAVGELQSVSKRQRQVWGTDCDVTKPYSVTRLASLAQGHFPGGKVDVWINNAGCSGSFKPFLEADDSDVQAVVHTNLLGALLCTRAALHLMSKQEGGGHVFNMDGAGADGTATPNYAAYGATKAGIAHLMQSISGEVSDSGLDVGVHTLSPGMVLTELLLDGATTANKQVFNVLCEQPEVVAAYLVPRVRSVAARNSPMTYIRSLTNLSAMMRFLTAPARLGRFFDSDGMSVYLPEAERLDGRQAKRTARLLAKARHRGATLALTYSAALTVSVFLLCTDRI